jgi:hypothetical protein
MEKIGTPSMTRFVQEFFLFLDGEPSQLLKCVDDGPFVGGKRVGAELQRRFQVFNGRLAGL